MQAYAAATTTKRNLEVLDAYGWRILYSAPRMDLFRPGRRYALDNGAWGVHKAGTRFDHGVFRSAVERYGADADFVIAPDIVGGGRRSLRMSEEALPWLLDHCPRVLIAVQDRLTPADLVGLVGPRVGIAIGGTTEWKEDQLFHGVWRQLDCYQHALRVNTCRRIRLCAGMDSLDGSSASKFSVNVPRLSRTIQEIS